MSITYVEVIAIVHHPPPQPASGPRAPGRPPPRCVLGVEPEHKRHIPAIMASRNSYSAYLVAISASTPARAARRRADTMITWSGLNTSLSAWHLSAVASTSIGCHSPRCTRAKKHVNTNRGDGTWRWHAHGHCTLGVRGRVHCRLVRAEVLDKNWPALSDHVGGHHEASPVRLVRYGRRNGHS